MRVSIVCQNPNDDRVLPRFGRLLRDRLGWELTASAAPTPDADVVYLLAYFEATRMKTWPECPVQQAGGYALASYFTHREEEPPGNAKAKLYDKVAGAVQLRVAMCRLYGEPLSRYGPTITPPLPVETDRFTIRARKAPIRPVVGLSGYTYSNHRKGEDLVRGLLGSTIGQKVAWVASGRGWPVPTKRYAWRDMPQFYQDLDILVCPSRVEGGPLPILEALSCGVRVVVPKGVGLIDELPDVAGIYRYERGDLASLTQALKLAVIMPVRVDREALRAAVSGHSVEAFVEAHRVGFEALVRGEDELDAGIDEAQVNERDIVEVNEVSENTSRRQLPADKEAEVAKVTAREPVERGTGSTRGIYVVAFGDPARKCALRLMKSIKTHMPDIPIALCAAKKVGPEDILLIQPDSDVGGRRAKLKAYDLAPVEWQAVLYLDADTEVVAPIYRFFEWIESGWEFVITKDPHLMDTLHSFKRRNNSLELAETEQKTKTLHAMQWNGGVWAFGRSPRIAAFFRRWQAEWERHAQRDQGALVRAMYADPLKILLLGNQWNTFPKYTKGITTAGLMHYPGDARRWSGLIPGRIDSPAAWAMVKKHEGARR